MPNIPYTPNLTTERGKHIDWCITRTRPYIDMDRLPDAWASFHSDMTKNPETATHPFLNTPLALAHMGNRSEFTRFIEGFK